VNPPRLSDEALSVHPTLYEVARRIALRVADVSPSYATSPRALIYGGYVRDILWGIRPKEADLQVFGVAPLLVESMLHELFPGCVRRAGKQYEVLKVELERGVIVDVSVPRRQTGGRSPHEFGDPNLTPHDAASFRDFTINSISADPLTGELFDPVDGATDIVKKILRVTDPENFPMRPVHVLRACQLTARFYLTPEPATIELLSSMVAAGATASIPGNAVAEEIKKLMKSKNPSHGLRLMHRTGVLHALFPQLKPPASDTCPTWREWLKKVDRTAGAMRNSRLNYGERSAGALATFFSLGKTPAEGEVDQYIEEMRELLSSLSLTPQMTATIIQLLLHLEGAPKLLDLPEKSPLRFAPARGTILPMQGGRLRNQERSYQPGRLEEASRFIRTLYPATWPVLSCLAAGIGGGDKGEYETLFTQTEAAHEIRMCHSILSGREVASITGIHCKEQLVEILDHLRMKRFELITPVRAKRYLEDLMKHSFQELSLPLASNQE